MATQQTQVLGRALLTPAVALLFIWMIVPLGDDDLFLDAALQPARSRKPGASSGWRIFDTFSPIPLF